MSKKDDKNKLILLKSNEEDKISNLTEEELQLKNKLYVIEDKLESIERIILSINKEKNNTIFDSEAFDILISSIAITASMNILADYFGLDIGEVNDFGDLL